MSGSTFWNERYREEGYVYGKAPNAFLEEALQYVPRHGRVLCLGDGEGRNGVYLAKQGLAVTSVDLSEKGKLKAENLARQEGVALTYIVGDLASYDIGQNAWDGIVSIFCHLPSALRRKVHAGCVRGLRAGGVFVLESYAPEQLKFDTGGPKDVDMLLDADTARTELLGLDFILCQTKVRTVIEGEFHTGQAAVTQVVARKPAEVGMAS